MGGSGSKFGFSARGLPYQVVVGVPSARRPGCGVARKDTGVVFDDDREVSRFGTAAPATAAMEWIEALLRGQFDSVWAVMTNDFRLAWVQDWIVRNPMVMSDPLVRGTRDDFAAELAVAEPSHPLWIHARRVIERTIRGSIENLANREIGTGSRPRPIGPDLELIRVIPLDQLDVDEHGVHQWRPGQTVENLTVLVQSSPDGWRLAGLSDRLPRPGWPPRFEVVVGSGD